MTKVTATEAARQFSDLLNKIKYQGKSYEVMRGGETVARIVPVRPVSALKVAELSDFFAELPELPDDEIDAFEKDLQGIRAEAGYVEGAWD